MIERITSMLERCGKKAEEVMPPTTLYNEGWLLRLVLDWFAVNNKHDDHLLSVPPGARWYSELLFPSQFLPRKRGDRLGESHTHADGVIGHFCVGQSGKGDIKLRKDATCLKVIEAKLGSRLSSGITHAPGYDQAARTTACIAHVLSVKNRRPDAFDELGFFVIAPASRIDDKVFDSQLNKEQMRDKVKARVTQYKSKRKLAWFEDWFVPTLEKMDIGTLSWETAISYINERDPQEGAQLDNFYSLCKYYNNLLKRDPI